ncbi:unnamed protein product [Peronospora belbahrii]|uniref:Sphingomyelin phosphodiesterase n=1 Tax=Peronospora belbahrii TaxID=622444 RepID=A0AAU9L517_9STRA|nr:unnamed protein product [Peronospora belbahrii]
MAAVAAGVAGVALTGSLSTVFALGGGVGKYQFNKTSYVKVTDGDVVQGLNSLWRMQSSSQGHDVRQGLEMRHIYTATNQVFMQLVAGEWAGQLLGMHGELITASKYSPAVFQLRTIHDEQKKDVCPETPAIPEPLAQDTNGSVSTVREGVSTWALQRASAIPRCIAPLNVDIVISCEAFCSSAQEKLVSKTKSQGFIYATKVVGDASLLGSKKAIDGGCFAMSKEMTFVLNNFGAETIETVHIVGTHLQAWETSLAVTTRTCQLVLMKEFVTFLSIPEHQVLVYAGDMNVNNTNAQSPIYSFDPHTRLLAVDGPSSGGITERLDYILVGRTYRQPLIASSEIIHPKATRHWAPSRKVFEEILVDLSDHSLPSFS